MISTSTIQREIKPFKYVKESRQQLKDLKAEQEKEKKKHDEMKKIPPGVPPNILRSPLMEGDKVIEFFEEENDPNLTEHQKDLAYKSRFQKRTFIPIGGKNIINWILGGYSNSTLSTKSARQAYEYTIWHVDNWTLFRSYWIPDDLFGWFAFNLLHFWMIKVRLRSEGKKGEKYLKSYENSFWQDVQQRLSILIEEGDYLAEELVKMQDACTHGMIAFDIGLMYGDAYLAEAFWRIVYRRRMMDPSVLSSLVKYVRREMKQLDSLDTNDILLKGYVQWGRAPPELSSMFNTKDSLNRFE
eukprot:TRINITY_DN1947_c0_g1_i3.p1 TRINITY_DN1947_c0_g1~~TRINITY_DN1947_c0_g1_i3.p1  ORF type:complete len:299 (+),score=90.88 TRINITY_DN1947_c0_g1_i3:217-1113(+)